MHIGFFADGYLPHGHGFAVSIESFRKELEARGHLVWIFVPSAPGYQDSHARTVRFPSIRVTSRPPIRLAVPFYRLKLPPLDIVHTHSPATMGILGSRVAKKRNVPHVYTSHADLINSARYYLLREPVVLPAMARWLTRWFGQQADHIIAPSPKIDRDLRRIGITQPITVLPTGIDISTFTRTEENEHRGETLRSQHKIP